MRLIPSASPNYFQEPSKGAWPIRGVVLHGTAGSLASSLFELQNPKHITPSLAVSANYLVSKAGTVYELVDPFAGKRAWCNGNMINPDLSVKWLARIFPAVLARKDNPNYYTVSIEHEANWGDMVDHNYKSVTDKQWAASQELTAYILHGFGLKANHETILTHGQFDSKNKTNCPGVLFGPSYAEQLIKTWPDLAG